MKQEPSYTTHRAKRSLVVCLAALFTLSAPVTWAQSDATKLQDENAALRKRLAELEGRTGAAPAAAAAATTDEDVTVLSPFNVTSEKDYGYLKTNAATATRIGLEIQKVPMNIAVISREFLDDTNANSLTDLFRYSAAAAGDTRFAMRVPANEATPQGGFTMRGFQVNTLMRDGIFRYTAYNLDNVERVEVVKGPASVFFGQGYPGGVINYITKRATFAKTPTIFSWTVDDNGGDKFKFDHNVVLDKHTAFRVVGAYTDTVGERTLEFRKGFSVTPSVTLNPFNSGKVQVKLDFEYLKERFNINDFEWIFSDFAGWKAAATTGQYGTSTAVLASTIGANAGNGLTSLTGLPGQQSNGSIIQSTTTPTVAYSTYINNKRTATGDLWIPAYTSIQRGAFYTNKAGQFIQDESFNWTSRGSWTDNEVKVMTAAVEFAPFDWFSGRYAWVRDVSNFNNYGNSAIVQPYADGVHFNVGLSAGGSGYYRETKTHLLDLVFSKDLFGIKNKLLIGGQKSDWRQLYMGKAGASDINLAFLPGARNTVSNPDYRGTNVAKYDFGGVPVNQIVKQRDGSIKPVRQLYSNWDPGAELNPDISVYWQDDRNALDGYRPTLQGVYANYQGSLFDDRLTVMAGYREEKRWERWQDQSNNFPWYIYTSDMIMNPSAYAEDVWGHSINYQKTIPLDQKGDSWMAGASYAINKNLNVYASTATIFKFNAGQVGGMFPGDELKIVQGIIDEYAARVAANPAFVDANGNNKFVYRGQTVTTVAQAAAIFEGLGYYKYIPNEQGKNYEIGAKYSSDDNKIVATVSLFSANRINRREDDGVAQSNANEPLNSATNPVWITGAARSGLVAPTASSTGRVFRVRSYGNKVKIEGAETEVIWTPVRNFQAVINASWMPTAKTVADNRPIYSKPGSDYYNNTLNAAQKRDSYILWNARVENVPEYRMNFFGKYTFNDGAARGLQVGAGMRYSSKTVVSRGVDWNPLNGGYQAGDYVVFDLTLGYPWEVLGYKLQTDFGVYNVTDKLYSEGSYVASPARNWIFRNTVKF